MKRIIIAAVLILMLVPSAMAVSLYNFTFEGFSAEQDALTEILQDKKDSNDLNPDDLFNRATYTYEMSSTRNIWVDIIPPGYRHNISSINLIYLMPQEKLDKLSSGTITGKFFDLKLGLRKKTDGSYETAAVLDNEGKDGCHQFFAHMEKTDNADGTINLTIKTYCEKRVWTKGKKLPGGDREGVLNTYYDKPQLLIYRGSVPSKKIAETDVKMPQDKNDNKIVGELLKDYKKCGTFYCVEYKDGKITGTLRGQADNISFKKEIGFSGCCGPESYDCPDNDPCIKINAVAGYVHLKNGTVIENIPVAATSPVK